MKNFHEAFSPANVKATMQAHGASSSDLWKIHPSKLRILEGFNARERTPKYLAHLENLTQSIIQNGFLVEHPLTGYVGKDGEDNVIYVTGGHTRHEAVNRAIELGHMIESVSVVTKPKGTSLEDLTVDQKVGNDGQPFSYLEQSTLCARLVTYGMPIAMIARKMGYKQISSVEDMLLLAGSPRAFRDHVAHEHISATLAVQLLRKLGNKALAHVDALMAKNQGSKVKPKDVPAIRHMQFLRKQAVPMFTAIQSVQADPAFASLAPETQQLLIDLTKTPPKP